MIAIIRRHRESGDEIIPCVRVAITLGKTVKLLMDDSSEKRFTIGTDSIIQIETREK